MLRPSPCCDAVSQRDETKTIKPFTNEAFVASSGDIITGYNDLYCLFTQRDTHYHVCICDRRNNKQQALTLLYTAQNFVSGRNVLTGCESEAPDCPCKVGIAPLYKNSLCASQHCRLLSPRFRTQSSVKCAAHTLIFGLNCSGTVL